jgi:hypothetical protein
LPIAFKHAASRKNKAVLIDNIKIFVHRAYRCPNAHTKRTKVFASFFKKKFFFCCRCLNLKAPQYQRRYDKFLENHNPQPGYRSPTET